MRTILLLLPLACIAQDWGSLHIVNGDLPVTNRLTLQVHTRVRTNDNFRDYFQTRGGPILTYQAARRLTLISGYYFVDEENQAGALSNFHRVFGGMTLLVPSPRKIKLEGRSLLEQFVATRNGNFLRARERLWATFGTRKIRPYAQIEGLVQQGIPTGRFGFGAQFVLRGGRDLFLGYEYRQLPGNSNLQLITSNFQFRYRPKRDEAKN